MHPEHALHPAYDLDEGGQCDMHHIRMKDSGKEFSEEIQSFGIFVNLTYILKNQDRSSIEPRILKDNNYHLA